MKSGQRLAVTIGSVALLLLIGRLAAAFYTDYAWYASLDAVAVWKLKLESYLLLYGALIIVGWIFAFLNIYAVRRSILSLMLPRRIGNVEIDAHVSPVKLVGIAAGISLCASIISAFAVKDWPGFALWKSGIQFGEIDPYFGNDLSQFVAWLPVETELYTWAFLLFAIVTLMVITLYALTPGLRWGPRGLKVTAYVRRHFSILAAILVFFIAWGLRLDLYELLLHGNGADGALTRIDHQWLIPAMRVAGVAILCTAFVLLFAGWMGQIQTTFVMVTAVLIALLVVRGVIPWYSARAASDPARSSLEQPYLETREIYTARGFPGEGKPLSSRYEADSSLLASAFQLQVHEGLPAIVYPGARGVVIEPDTGGEVSAPRLNGLFERIMYAWAEQNPQIVRSHGGMSPVIVRHRDLRQRIEMLAPIFAQSQAVGVRSSVRGVTWIVDLYAISDHYPLSEPRKSGDLEFRYRRHAATAFVDAMTGRVSIIPSVPLDPISETWFRAAAGKYVVSGPPGDLVDGSPTPFPSDSLSSLDSADSAFRARITNIYLWMRATIQSGDFTGFGAALDSLGVEVGIPK